MILALTDWHVFSCSVYNDIFLPSSPWIFFFFLSEAKSNIVSWQIWKWITFLNHSQEIVQVLIVWIIFILPTQKFIRQPSYQNYLSKIFKFNQLTWINLMALYSSWSQLISSATVTWENFFHETVVYYILRSIEWLWQVQKRSFFFD